MARAGLFIGVDRTGQLDPLADAATGAARMLEWFRTEQGVPDTHTRLVTDAGAVPVTADGIYTAAAALLALPDVDQLLVYFAGHGIYTNGSEQWLLTDAPARASAAIDLGVSIEHARRLKLAYVAIFADTCRVSPTGIQATGVRGQSLFPNQEQRGRSKPVDIFYASIRGQQAAEIPAARDAASEYRAVFTTELLKGLSGTDPDVLQLIDPQDSASYVMPTRLADFLTDAIPDALIAANVAHKHDQTPDFLLSAGHSCWLARITDPPREPRNTGTGSSTGSRPRVSGAAGRMRVPQVLAAIAANPASAIEKATGVPAPGAAPADDIDETARAVAAAFGKESRETGCGIKVRGARLTSVQSRAALVEPPDADRINVRVNITAGSEAAVVDIANTGVALVPVSHGYFSAITVHGGALLDLALEPMPTRPAVAISPDQLTHVRALRGYVAAAARRGQLRPRGRTLDQLIDGASYGAGCMDFTIGMLLAYAAHESGRTAQVERIRNAVCTTLRAPVFDLEMLARLHDLPPWTAVPGGDAQETYAAPGELLPPVPLLARGWVMVDAGLATVPETLAPLRDDLMESLWSLYRPSAAPLLMRALGPGSLPLLERNR